ncbi:MAG: hydroxyisourate hydrolase [Pseudomonadota bacterium]
MAIVSSHTLNATDGTHAGGIPVTLTGPGGILFETEMDPGGRLAQEVDLAGADPEAVYELVFNIADWWAAQGHSTGLQDEIVLRFRMPDPDGRYHMPIILSPNGYSTWSSTPTG